MAKTLEKIQGSFTHLLGICWGVSTAITLALVTEQNSIFPEKDDPTLELALLGVIAYAIGFAIPAMVTIVRHRRPLKETVDRRNVTEGFSSRRLRDNVQKYLTESEKDMGVLIKNMKAGKVTLDKAQYVKFFDILFSTPLPYYAVDSSLPSEYQKLNPTFLAAHASSLDEDLSKVKDYRVLMHNAEDLEDDAKNDSYTDFYDWHKNHSVKLLYLSRSMCEEIMSKNHIDPNECIFGMAIWGNDFAVLFGGNPKENRFKSQLTIIDDNNVRFKNVLKACKEIRSKSKEVGRAGAYYSMNSSLMAKWEKFVRPDERWLRIRPFMLHVLEDCNKRERTVLDAAAGIGFEFYRLREAGYSVDANEVMEPFQDIGKEYAKDSGYNIVYAPTSHTWSQMAVIGWDNRFGAVLVMGNSLRTMSAKYQQGIINTFHSILKKDGVLVIDERNYDVIMEHASVVNACGNNEDSASAFLDANKLEKTQNPLYNGTNVGSVPFRVSSENDYTVCYYEDTGMIKTLKEARAHELQVWEFHHSEKMEDLLKEAGFSKIEKYVDYDLSENLELGKTDAKASMFTYVATK